MAKSSSVNGGGVQSDPTARQAMTVRPSSSFYTSGMPLLPPLESRLTLHRKRVLARFV
jgi:hypothetical protein